MTMEALCNVSPSCAHSRADSERFMSVSVLTFPMGWKFQVLGTAFLAKEDELSLENLTRLIS